MKDNLEFKGGQSILQPTEIKGEEHALSPQRIRITIEYDGTPYCGWQIQPNVKTIQGELEQALAKLYGQNVGIVGSGRTDTGVHALAQVAHFDPVKHYEVNTVKNALNFYLPPHIRIKDASIASADFNARFCAVGKTYLYKMLLSDECRPLYLNRALIVPTDIDIDAMQRAATYVEGEHDFKSFMASNSDVVNTVRTVFNAQLNRLGNQLDFTITANGFLYNMVRIIVAQLLKCGMGKMSPDALPKIISACDRNQCKELAPPYALYLMNVEY